MAEKIATEAEDINNFAFEKGNGLRWFLIISSLTIMALPMFGVRVPPISQSYIGLLLVHEFSGFFFFGHTLFSNIWAMKVRTAGDEKVGIMARAMLRKMAMGITLPTSIITPLFGVMLVELVYGGFVNAPWAFEAYLLFWIMAAIQLVPDLVRYAVDEQANKPKAGVKGAALRGVGSTVLTLMIIWLMVTKESFFIGAGFVEALAFFG